MFFYLRSAGPAGPWLYKVLEKAVNDTTAYMTSSLFNCVRGVVTAMQLTSLFPITAVGWLTAL